MNLVRSFTVMLLATVSFNIAAYASDRDDLTEAVSRGGKLKSQPAPTGKKAGRNAPPKGKKSVELIPDKEKEDKSKAVSLSPADEEAIVDGQGEDETTMPTPAIGDEAVVFDGDGAVDDKEKSPPAAVDIVSASTSSITPAPVAKEKEDKDKIGQTPAPSGEEDAHLADGEEAEIVSTPTPPAEKEEEQLSASSAAATPKLYQAIIDRLVGEFGTYTDARGASTSSYSFPTRIEFSTFSEMPDTEFNPLFREVADEFYTLYGSGDEKIFSQAKERVMVLISQKILQMTEQKQKLIHDQEGREDGILKELKVPVTKLEEHIVTYELLFKETLYRMNETRTFVQYILNAIKVTRASIDALKDMLLKETSAIMRASHEEGISKLSSNIEKFQSWLLSTEVVIHTLYPFHRERSYFLGMVPLPQLGQKSSRRELTGVVNLPPSLTLTAGDIVDSKIDEHQHLTKYMQAMLGLDGVMLTQAKTQKRFTEVKEDK